MKPTQDKAVALPVEQFTPKQISDFVRGYLAAALWSTSYTPTDEEGNDCGPTVELDRYEWAEGEAEKLHADCLAFMEANAVDLKEYADQISYDPGQGSAWDYAGHDFWLTRNGHGVGYWDRQLAELGDRLTTACKQFATVDLYLGDDELVYVG